MIVNDYELSKLKEDNSIIWLNIALATWASAPNQHIGIMQDGTKIYYK